MKYILTILKCLVLDSSRVDTSWTVLTIDSRNVTSKGLTHRKYSFISKDSELLFFVACFHLVVTHLKYNLLG